MAVAAKDVAIIGGGFAGLSAGVALAQRGFRVALLESKPALGGRAYSFTQPGSDDFIDNGQHVLMGCYHATLDFLKTLGTRDRLVAHRNLEIEMLAGPGRRAVVRTAPLPGPFHMTGAILGYGHLSMRQRASLLRAGMRLMYLRRFAPARLRRITVAEYMDSSRQDDHTRRSFWYPMTLATLNELPEIASAMLLAEVLKRAFFSRRSDSAFLYSTVGLSDLYCTAATKFIERYDGVVACRAIVERFELDAHGNLATLRLRDGRGLQAANFIAAVTPDRLLKMLPEGATADPVFAGLASLRSSPTVCAHVWLDREVTRSAFIGFIGTQTQWLFNKRRIFAQHSDDHPGYLSFVISGARDLVDRSNDDLLEIVMRDLRAMIPAARAAQVLKALVIKEKQATIAPDPQSDALRPSVTTPIPNLFLAGDWTQTGLPATIESAVISGNRATAAIATRVSAG
ncbi:MAG TPA: hydroxysqualene dehydroxylase HpnE [Candidatus Binataceae bacterium]|nr:hydroxysqualene dehydroxylase HpnE [Candidatus Binataceae bacterium]